MKIRPLSAHDRVPLARMLAKIADFTEADQLLAMELINFSIDHPGQKDYFFDLAVNEEDLPIAYACYGPIPLTEGVYDLYWIAVDPAYAGQGIGTRLLKIVEEEIHNRQGRMMLIETSSSVHYALTRKFYLKAGYFLVETIQDFYRPGEDRVTYEKRF